MFDWVDLLFAFVAGGLVAIGALALIVRQWVMRLRKALEDAVEESNQATDSDKIIPLTVEFENNLFYCYNSKTNQFICQGADVNEIIDQFKTRFPGINAFFESGDSRAIETLTQQLREKQKSTKLSNTLD